MKKERKEGLYNVVNLIQNDKELANTAVKLENAISVIKTFKAQVCHFCVIKHNCNCFQTGFQNTSQLPLTRQTEIPVPNSNH